MPIKAVITADILERTRHARFLQSLFFFVMVATIFVPGDAAAYATLTSGDFIVSSRSGMVGTTVALLMSVSLLLFGPFLAGGGIERDRKTKVGEILATTPLPHWQYLGGKWASNFLLLCLIAFVVQLTAAIVFPFRGTGPFNLFDFVIPLVGVTFVATGVVAAMAVLWETLRLNQVPGSAILYVLLAVLTMAPGLLIANFPDLTAVGDYSRQLKLMNSQIEQIAFGIVPITANQQFMIVSGIQLTNGFIAGRLFWFIITAGLLWLSTKLWRIEPAGKAAAEPTPTTRPTNTEIRPALSPIAIPEMPVASQRASLWLMSLAEVRLSLPRSRWLWLIIVLPWITAVFVPLKLLRQTAVPLAVLILIPLLSPLATREPAFGMTDLINSLPQVKNRYIIWKCLAGLMLTSLVIAGLLIRLTLEAPVAALGLLAGSIFSLSWLIFAGYWRGAPQLGTVTLTFFWYASSWNNTPPWLDYMGIRILPADWLVPLMYVSFGLLLIIAATVLQKLSR